MCRSRRELSNTYFLAKFGFDTAENEPSDVCQGKLSDLGSEGEPAADLRGRAGPADAGRRARRRLHPRARRRDHALERGGRGPLPLPRGPRLRLAVTGHHVLRVAGAGSLG